MSDTYIYIAIVITAIATYLPRFLGVFSSDFVNEEGKLSHYMEWYDSADLSKEFD